jgi:hypothetical protein
LLPSLPLTDTESEYVVVMVSVEGAPAEIEAGLADMLTVGAGFELTAVLPHPLNSRDRNKPETKDKIRARERRGLRVNEVSFEHARFPVQRLIEPGDQTALVQARSPPLRDPRPHERRLSGLKTNP